MVHFLSLFLFRELIDKDHPNVNKALNLKQSLDVGKYIDFIHYLAHFMIISRELIDKDHYNFITLRSFSINTSYTYTQYV